MQPSLNTQLVDALTAELSALRTFFAVLEHERTLLVENSTEELLTATEQKSALAITLNELTEARRDLLGKSAAELTVSGIHSWLEAHSSEGLKIWQEIRTLAEQAQQFNGVNGELIQMKLRLTQQTLAALSSAANKANLYGPDGQTSFAPGSGRSLGSV